MATSQFPAPVDALRQSGSAGTGKIKDATHLTLTRGGNPGGLSVTTAPGKSSGGGSVRIQPEAPAGSEDEGAGAERCLHL